MERIKALTKKKTGITKNGKKIGRPTRIDAACERKLIDAFKTGASAEQACAYAGITSKTFRTKKQSDERFYREIKIAQSYPAMLAKNLIFKKIRDGSDVNARWWLEKNEYNNNNNNTNVQVNITGHHKHIETNFIEDRENGDN